MLSPRLSHFLAISLALHAAALLVARSDRPQLNWLAGPVIVRLVPAPGSTPESRPTSDGMAAAVKTQQAATLQTTTAAERFLPQRHPARLPATLPAVAENLPDTDAPAGSTQQQAAATATRTATLEQQLLDSLHTALMPHFSYPLLARRRGWEGIVRVGLRIEANGNLTRLHLVEPSPYEVLNTAAINSLSRLARLPNAGTWLQGRHVDLILPVEYRLLEG
jgi:periplasmic protein TonB